MVTRKNGAKQHEKKCFFYWFDTRKFEKKISIPYFKVISQIIRYDTIKKMMILPYFTGKIEKTKRFSQKMDIFYKKNMNIPRKNGFQINIRFPLSSKMAKILRFKVLAIFLREKMFVFQEKPVEYDNFSNFLVFLP